MNSRIWKGNGLDRKENRGKIETDNKKQEKWKGN